MMSTILARQCSRQNSSRTINPFSFSASAIRRRSSSVGYNTIRSVSLIIVVIVQLLQQQQQYVIVYAGRHTLIQKIKDHYPDFVPHTIVDVGANRGMYAEYVRKTYPYAVILMFEGSDHHYESLQQFILKDLEVAAKIKENDPTTTTSNIPQSEYHLGILSSTDGEIVQYYDSKGSTGNSLFREKTEFFDNIKPIEKVTRTLDTAIAQSPLYQSLRNSSSSVVQPSIDIIKTDVQGSELIVLQGATKALQEATFVQLEGSIIEYNSGGACMYQIDSYLRSLGYYLYDVADFQYNPPLFHTKGLGQYDVLYVRPSSPKLPQYLKEYNTTFCGAGRHPLDLPGVYDIQKQQPVVRSSSSSSCDSSRTNDSSLSTSWRHGFGMGIVSSTIVAVCIFTVRIYYPNAIQYYRSYKSKQ